MIDLAVLAPDPRFGGGGRAQTEAFWDGARALGREPRLYAVAYQGLRGRDPGRLGDGERIPALPGADALSQRLAARVFGPRVAHARSAWVVSPVASHGYAALRARRPYGAWIGTSLTEEWAARRPYLGRARRAALGGSSRSLRRIERETLRGATRLYATSPASRASLATAAGLDAAEIGLLPIPVDVDHFAPAPDDAWRLGLDHPTIVFVGRGDDPRKNVELLLDAFEQVPDARLLLVGAPPARRLPARATALGEAADVATVLREGTIFVLPSRQEGFGIVAAEALAAGVPVVTTPSGGPESLVRESGGGRVLEGFGPDELAATLQELLADVDTLAAMRAAGREYVVREHAPTRFRSLLATALASVDEP